MAPSPLGPILALASLLATLLSSPASAQSQTPVNHVVIVWLKEHDNPAAQQRYIEISRTQSKLPMVVRYAIGTDVPRGDTGVKSRNPCPTACSNSASTATAQVQGRRDG